MHELFLEVPSLEGPIPAFTAVPQDVTVAPGVLVFMDVFGPRAELQDIVRRFASCGYVAVLPNLFHRLGSPTFEPMNRPEDTLSAEALRANGATTITGSGDDASALIAYADTGALGVAVPLWGAIGYCMGARHALGATARQPQRIRAALSVHGGRLVDESAESPHRLIEATTAPLYFAMAKDDATCPADHQRKIAAAARETEGRVSVEYFDAHHGWSFPDRWCFDRTASERVWERALAMFRASLWTRHAPRRR